MKSTILLMLFSVLSSLVQAKPLDTIHRETNPFIARSCLEYLHHGESEDGFYWLLDDQDQRYMAYCDLSSEPSSAWTLVMSWNRASKGLPNFQRKALPQDAPINHHAPNWNVYRQTLARMKSLRSRSTHWRATCSFNLVEGIDYRDYIRAEFSNLDVMTFLGAGKCFPVEYVNIRGHVGGSGITVPFWQAQDRYAIHTDSFSTNCAFNPNADAVSSEDNFGHYSRVNSNFRCTASDVSTTQWWFGGYLA